MITCVAINPTTVTVTIQGKNFEEELEKFKKVVPYERRRFDGSKFIVRNAHTLTHVKYIQAALKEFKLQLRLL